MKRIKETLYFSENTIKFAKEKANKQGIDYKVYLVSKIENEVFKEYVEGLFEPVKKFNGKKKYKHRKSDNNVKCKNSSL